MAYDAIRMSATAALRAAGYRVVRGGSEHYRTIEALEFSIDPQRKLIPDLDKLRKKRNRKLFLFRSYSEGIHHRSWKLFLAVLAANRERL